MQPIEKKVKKLRRDNNPPQLLAIEEVVSREIFSIIY